MPQSWLEERRKFGVDRFDEMWDGVLHVNAFPGNPHQRFRDQLRDFLRDLQRELAVPGEWGTERNLAKPRGWPLDYRAPDMLFLGVRCRAKDMGSHYVGPPDIAVEVAGDDDESRAKLPWYAELGIPEIWIIDLASRVPDILLLSGSEYLKQRPGTGNWFRSEGFPVELRAGRAGKRKVLEVRAPGETKARARL